MTHGDRAVVVDYKFGELQAARYRTQIGSYMLLLRQMAVSYTHLDVYKRQDDKSSPYRP